MVKFRLEMTCFACPEQYDVYLEDEKVGYLRLRHGHFRCDVPDCGGKSSDEETLRQMMLAGMNVARFNMSHGTHESHRQLIDKVKNLLRQI